MINWQAVSHVGGFQKEAWLTGHFYGIERGVASNYQLINPTIMADIDLQIDAQPHKVRSKKMSTRIDMTPMEVPILT